MRLSRWRPSRLAVVAVLLAYSPILSACGADLTAHSVGDAPPDEGTTRAAYLDTPMITPAMVAAVPPGISKRALFRRFGRSFLAYRHLSVPSETCVSYPILGSQRWDSFGTPLADEWEFCFGRAGRLREAARIRVVQASRTGG